MMFRRVLMSLVSAGVLFAANAATAQAPFPTGAPLRVITPYGAGGGLDVAARILSATGREIVGTRIDIVNMPGAGGLDAATFVRNAQPDGQTLLMTDYGPVITIPLRERVTYTPDDWVPLVQVTEVVPAIATRTQSGITTFADLLTRARANPGNLSIAIGTFLSSNHIPMILLEQRAGIRTNAIPTSGGAETLTFLLGGTVDVGVITPASIAGAVRAGNARVLAVMSAERFPTLPDVPTLRELGFDVVMPVWYTIFAHRNVPAERRALLAERIVRAYASPEAQALAQRGNLIVRPLGMQEVAPIYARTVTDVRAALQAVQR